MLHPFCLSLGRTLCLALLCLASLGRLCSADDRINHEGISGRLIICGGGKVPSDVAPLLQSAVGENGTLAIIPDAAENPAAAAEGAKTWLSDALAADAMPIRFAVCDAAASGEQRVVATAEILRTANAVWVCGGQQSRLNQLFVGTTVETELQNLLKRGGTIAGTSAGAAIMSKTMIASGNDEPVMSAGFDLLPGAIVDQHFSERMRQARSRRAVSLHPGHFGLGIDEATAVVVQDRRMVVVGDGTATILLAECEWRGAEEMRLAAGERADVTQLRRAALSRASRDNPDQPTQPSPVVPHGALVIVGGGGMPQDVVDRFIELAGGTEAHIVCLPTAVPRNEALSQRLPGFLANANVASVTLLPQSRTEEIASPEYQQALKRATGIWFGGGRQWNFVDAYNNTNAIELFHDVLKRGGVIGGSSAGATIQGDFLVRGHPLGNTVMMAEGYERGFAFLPAAAIDQHFAQRGRQADLLPVIRRHPQFLGIGIDEATAVVVQKSTAQIIGQHAAHFVKADRLPADTAALPETAKEAASLYVDAISGQSIDLVTLAVSETFSVEHGVPASDAE